MQFRELALDFKQETCYRIGFASHIFEFFRIEFQNLIEVGKQSLGFENISGIIQFYISAFFFIVLIIDFTNDFFDNVLHRYNSRSSTKLIHHNGNMNLVGLEIAQQIVDFLGFRNEISRANQCLPTEIVTLVQMRQQVLDIKDTFYIITGIHIYRNTGISVVDHTFQNFRIWSVDFQIYHIQPWCHYLLDGFRTKTDNTLQDIAFFGYLCLVRQFEGLRKFIYRNAVISFGHQLIYDKS